MAKKKEKKAAKPKAAAKVKKSVKPKTAAKKRAAKPRVKARKPASKPTKKPAAARAVSKPKAKKRAEKKSPPPKRAKKPVARPAKKGAREPAPKRAKKPAARPAKTRVSKPARKPSILSVEAAIMPFDLPPLPEKPPAAKPSEKGKMLPSDFLIGVAAAIREAVLPAIVAANGRDGGGAHVAGADAVTELGKTAEKALEAFLKQAKLPVAYYSKGEGYATFSSAQPRNLLIVNPVDGMRAAKSGFDGCVVAVASTRVIERPRMADIDNACVIEILGNRTFYAARGRGARIQAEGHVRRPKLSKNMALEALSWSMTVPGRPAELIFPTAAKLIDLSSLKGGFFACNSTSFSLTRLLTNQLDACVDFANRFLRDISGLVKDQFINAGRGAVMGIVPYDIAASLFIAQEAGCKVTDAYGKSFDEVLLLEGGSANHHSFIAAANAPLHAKLMSFFDTRINQFELLLKRRAETGA